MIHTIPNYKELGHTHQSEANTDGNGTDSHCGVPLGSARCGAGVRVWPYMVRNCEVFGCKQCSEVKPGSNFTDSYYAVTFGTLQYRLPHLSAQHINCEEFGQAERSEVKSDWDCTDMYYAVTFGRAYYRHPPPGRTPYQLLRVWSRAAI